MGEWQPSSKVAEVAMPQKRCKSHGADSGCGADQDDEEFPKIEKANSLVVQQARDQADSSRQNLGTGMGAGSLASLTLHTSRFGELQECLSSGSTPSQLSDSVGSIMGKIATPRPSPTQNLNVETMQDRRMKSEHEPAKPPATPTGKMQLSQQDAWSTTPSGRKRKCDHLDLTGEDGPATPITASYTPLVTPTSSQSQQPIHTGDDEDEEHIEDELENIALRRQEIFWTREKKCLNDEAEETAAFELELIALRREEKCLTRKLKVLRQISTPVKTEKYS